MQKQRLNGSQTFKKKYKISLKKLLINGKSRCIINKRLEPERSRSGFFRTINDKGRCFLMTIRSNVNFNPADVFAGQDSRAVKAWVDLGKNQEMTLLEKSKKRSRDCLFYCC